MKKRFFRGFTLPYGLMILCIALNFFSACQSSSTDVQFKHRIWDDSLTISDDRNIPSCRYYIDFAYAEGKEGDTISELINEELARRVLGINEELPPAKAVEMFVADFVAGYRNSVTDFYFLADSLEKTNSLHKTDAWNNWFCYEMDLKTTVSASRMGRVANYVAEKETYMGGPHPNFSAKWLNFDTQTGCLLTLKNIMLPDYEPVLLEALTDALKVECNAETIEGIREAGYLNWSEMFVPANFLIKDDGILFLFNPYEIAPWSMGSTELFVNDETLKQILKPIEEWK